MSQCHMHTKGAAMTITLEVPPRLGALLRDLMARHGEAAQGLLNAAFATALEALLASTPPPLTDAEFEALADQLTEEWDADGGAGLVLPDEALTREGIYGDHP
jgi:hypothetical protein